MVSCSLVGAGVGLPYKEGDYFGNILMPNDTFLILVKIQPIKGTVHLVYTAVIIIRVFC